VRNITYDARVYKTEVYRGKTVTTYTVRWRAGDKPWKEPFRNKAQSESFRSSLLSAARNGEAFSITTGRPLSWQRTENDKSWYEFACAYVDMKWKLASGGYRRDIARALVATTPAMLENKHGRPDDAKIRKALMRWGFNAQDRDDCPDEFANVLRWVSRSSKPVSSLADPATTRKVLDTISTRLNGKRAAASTAHRNRAILHNALEFAVEGKILTDNPIKEIKQKAPKVSNEVDRRSVVNPTQGRTLLDAVSREKPSGPRLAAFFGVMYYAALRPEEVVSLRRDNLTLPPLVWNEEAAQWEEPTDDWGELHFGLAAPDIGKEWTDDRTQRDERPLKHRAAGETRTVPCTPELTKLLRAHLAEFGTGPGGRIFWGFRGGELPTVTYRRVWDKARREAFTADEYASPLARRPYDLRHACLSTWLNGGVPATQVAEWAGHSVEVLLRIYAKCLVGQHEIAKRRISEALRQT